MSIIDLQGASAKSIFSGLGKIIALRTKRDVWTFIFLAFIGVLAWHHSIGDMAVAALASPIVAKIFSDHHKAIKQMDIDSKAGK